MRLGLTLYIIIVLPLICNGQSEHCQWVKYSPKGQIIDSLSILPNSFKIKNNQSIKIKYDINSRQVHFSEAFKDSLLICYTVLPFNLSKKKFKRDPSVYDSTDEYSDLNITTVDTKIEQKKESILETPNIDKQGNYTRGLSFGNRQSVFVNSSLNLQLEGKITDNINILANISDQNLPFQPEGNTQQLQEFDKIFIQLFNKKSKLTAGDIVLKNYPKNYFLKYYKNIQGLSIAHNYNVSDSIQAYSQVAVAVSKGKFANIQLKALEGIQGPYRLEGPNGERFIIVLAGSEKIYLDGQLLERGFDYDYTIDYNLAEITFNTNIVITQFSRIRAEFEYSEQNYARSILSTTHQFKHHSTDFSINYYREADNFRNDLIELSEQNKLFLSEIGDKKENAIISAINPAEYQVGKILYTKTDITTENGVYQDVLKFSSDSTQTLYSVQFTNVGQNNGDYILSNNTNNGRVFEWVEPLGNIPQGNYSPIVQVPLPQSKRVLSLSGKYKLNTNENFWGEIAFSSFDLNRFSRLDNQDNAGTAFKIGYENLGKKLFKDYQYIFTIDYEQNQKNFKPIDRFRKIEYDRNWSAKTDTAQNKEQILSASIGIMKDSTNHKSNDQLTYTIQRRVNTSLINGWQHQVKAQKKTGIIETKAKWFLMENNTKVAKSNWQRLNTDLGLAINKHKLGIQYNLDRNIYTLKSQDSLTTNMYYDEYVGYFKTCDSCAINVSLDYTFRNDYFPVQKTFKKNTESQTINLQLSSSFLKNTQFISLITSYRKLDNYLKLTKNSQNSENIMGRVDWNGSFWKKNIKSNFVFSTASGRALKREFVFIPVAIGEGTHVWRDENEDNVQDLNEFYLAINPDEKQFIKLFTPTNEYIASYQNNFSHRLHLKFPNEWKKNTFLKRSLYKFSFLSSWTIQRRFTDDDIYNRIVPFSRKINNKDLLSTQENFRSTLFFNRNNRKFGANFKYINTIKKQLLSNGFEARNKKDFKLLLRNNIGSFWNIQISGTLSNIENSSDFLLTRNFNISSKEISPELAFQPLKNIRFIGKYRLSKKENSIDKIVQEKADINQFSLEIRWNKVGSRSLLAKLNYINIAFDGENPNAPASYELLEALRTGSNWTWSLNLQQKIANGLQITFNYEGRKSPTLSVIHVGRMQVSALF